MCEALFDISTFYNIPMTSGKDSMKNDFVSEGVKISVPPTILYSIVAKIDDVRKTVTTEFKKDGDLIYLIGKTYNELGGSEFYSLFNELGANIPVVRKERAKRIYQKIMAANEQQLISSCHDISDGGMAVALVESAFGGDLGIDVNLKSEKLNLNATLFSESHSRFIVSIAPKHNNHFEAIMGEDCKFLGEVIKAKQIILRWDSKPIVDIAVENILNAWRSGLKI